MNARDGEERLGGLKPFPQLRRIGFVVAAVLLYVLLLDLAVETFARGSPLRWWVGGAVLLYLAATAHLWRCLRWADRVAAPAVFLLGLISGSAWLPGGLYHGVALLGLGTSTVFAAVSALAVLTAGVFLVRAPFLPPWAKLLCGGLAAYGVAAFTLPISGEFTYAELLQGGSIWTRLPFWLQGGFVGAAVVLPAGLLFRAAQGWATRGDRSLYLFGVQLLALGLCLLLPLQALLAGRGGTATLAGLRNALEPDPDARSMTGQELRRHLSALEQGSEEIPRDAFDPRAIVDRVGSDPADLSAWVRENTVLVPYLGVLRGPMGVLMDRTGNSLDRALLLRELLRAAGHDNVRLVRARLTEEQTSEMMRDVLATSQSVRTPERTEVPTATTTHIAALARRHGLDPAPLLRGHRGLRRFEREIRETAVDRASDQYERLIDMLGEPETAVGEAGSNWHRRALRDHWWLQYWDGAVWTDLDPAAVRSPGGPGTGQIRGTFRRDALPDSLWHRVRVRVVIEHAEKGQLHESVPLSQSLIPARLHGDPVVLRHVPLNWPTDSTPGSQTVERDTVLETLRGQDLWLPLLTVGDRVVHESAFYERGDLISVKDPMTVLAGKVGTWQRHMTEDATGALEALPGGDDQGAGAGAPGSPPQLTAEWIEYEITVPGRDATTVRRQIFDLIGPAARGGDSELPEIGEDERLSWRLSLVGKSEILLQANQIAPTHLIYRAARALVDNRDMLLRLVEEPDAEPSIGGGQRDGRSRLPGPSLALALARGGPPSAPDGVITFIDRPNILAYHEQKLLDTDGNLTQLRGFDIVRNHVGVVSDSPRKSFEARVSQGVWDATAEALLLDGVCEAPPDSSGCAEAMSASEVFATATRRGFDWIAIRGSDDPVLEEIGIPADVRTRIARDLASNRVVVLPDPDYTVNRTPVAWWSVAEGKGHTIGIGDRGWGQEYVEYTLQTVNFFVCPFSVALSSQDPVMAGVKTGLCVVSFSAATLSVAAAPGFQLVQLSATQQYLLTNVSTVLSAISYAGFRSHGGFF